MDINNEINFQYSILSCIGNRIHSLAMISRKCYFVQLTLQPSTRFFWLSLEFNLRNCKGNQVSSYINMDDEAIFQYSIQKCIGSTIYSLETFSRVMEGSTFMLNSSIQIDWFQFLESKWIIQCIREIYIIVYKCQKQCSMDLRRRDVEQA